LQAGHHSRIGAMREPPSSPVRFAHHPDTGCGRRAAASTEPHRRSPPRCDELPQPLLIS